MRECLRRKNIGVSCLDFGSLGSRRGTVAELELGGADESVAGIAACLNAPMTFALAAARRSGLGVVTTGDIQVGRLGDGGVGGAGSRRLGERLVGHWQ